MAFYVPLPVRPGGKSPGYINIVDGQSSAVQRALRRDGLAGYEPPTMASMLALFSLQPADWTFFDVGANVGLYSLLCGKFHPEANIVAFEPTPDTARIARKLLRVNRIQATLEEKALGDSPGSAEFFLSAVSDASNSLVEGFKKNVGSISVNVATLDDYTAATGSVPNVMKIDTESFEPQVIAGGMQTLRKHRPYMIVEVLNRKNHDHGIEMMEAMKDLGYTFYQCSVYSEWQPMETIEGAEGRDRDWLLAPEALPENFLESVEAWEEVLARCRADRNTDVLPSPKKHAGHVEQWTLDTHAEPSIGGRDLTAKAFRASKTLVHRIRSSISG